MIDLKFLRENPEVVKQNIKNKFQDHKLPLVDEVIELDAEARKTQQEADDLRAKRNQLSKEIGKLMGQGKKDEAEAVKAQVAEGAARLAELEEKEKELQEKVTKIMMTIPNIIDPSVPIGKDDSCNVEIEKFGEPVVPDFEIPYHTEIMERFNGIDLDAAGKVAGNGFYYLMGDIARVHSAVLSYARDFMIDRGFTYVVPPFMIRSNVVTGVMSFDEMDAMMYKIEGEDLYLIGTSEHSMIGKFIDTINDEEKLPYTLTSYSPCFRKEKGAHGIEERGVYRIHQFEKQEMIVVCKPDVDRKAPSVPGLCERPSGTDPAAVLALRPVDMVEQLSHAQIRRLSHNLAAVCGSRSIKQRRKRNDSGSHPPLHAAHRKRPGS